MQQKTLDIKSAVSYLNERSGENLKAGIVLGSGLNGAFKDFHQVAEIDFKDIPGFPVSTVSGHPGKFLIGEMSGVKVIIMQGRIHYYEGYTMEEVVMPVRTMCMSGIETLLLTNAAGGIADDLMPGDLMVIRDHISSFIPSPLIGSGDDSEGNRFVDMTESYDKDLACRLCHIIEDCGLIAKKGVYLQVTGPCYETPAEINAYKMLGADAVGMSTVCETMAARQMGVRVAGLSIISNKASGYSSSINHQEVLDTGLKMNGYVSEIIYEFIRKV